MGEEERRKLGTRSLGGHSVQILRTTHRPAFWVMASLLLSLADALEFTNPAVHISADNFVFKIIPLV